MHIIGPGYFFLTKGGVKKQDELENPLDREGEEALDVDLKAEILSNV